MLATLDDVNRELNAQDFNTNAATVPYNETEIMRAIATASARIQGHAYINEYFEPVIETRYYDALYQSQGGPFTIKKMWLDRYMLSVDNFVIEGDSVADYYAGPKGDRAYNRLFRNNGYYFSLGVSDPYNAVEVTGTWARVKKPSEAWVDSLATNTGSLNATATEIDLDSDDPESVDAKYNAPRFSPGHLIRIESEFMRVNAVSPVSPFKLIVTRGVNGSTAAAHETEQSIYVWYPDTEIKQAARRWSALIYKRRNHHETKRVEGMAEITYPKDMPTDVWEILSKGGYAKMAGSIIAG